MAKLVLCLEEYGGREDGGAGDVIDVITIDSLVGVARDVVLEKK